MKVKVFEESNGFQGKYMIRTPDYLEGSTSLIGHVFLIAHI